MHRNYMNGPDISTNTHVQIDQSILGCMPWNILRLWGFLCVRNAGCRGNKITEFLGFVWWVWSAKWCNTMFEKTLYNAQNTIHSYVQCLLQHQEHTQYVTPISLFWIICLRNKIRIVGIMPWCTFVKILFA